MSSSRSVLEYQAAQIDFLRFQDIYVTSQQSPSLNIEKRFRNPSPKVWNKNPTPAVANRTPLFHHPIPMPTRAAHAARLKASPRADPRHAWHVLPRSVPALEPGSSAAVRRLAQAMSKIAKI